MKSLLVTLLFVLLASPALALPAISCHCFQDRSFDPQRAAAADPYFLATTQNSLLAANFGIDKKDVVRAKMAGTSGSELWVAHYLAAQTGRPAGELQAAKADRSTWPEALTALGIDPLTLVGRPAVALRQGVAEDEAARIIVEDVLVQRIGADQGELAKMGSGGASLQETILAVFISRQTDGTAMTYFEAVRSKNHTWGSLLDGLQIAPRDIEARVRRILK